MTGDSAGGHLAAVASLMTNMIGSRGFGKTPGVFEFMPSYLPKGKTAEQVRDETVEGDQGRGAELRRVQRRDAERLLGRSTRDDLAWKDADRAAQPHSRRRAERAVPQFLTRGTQRPADHRTPR